MHSYDEWEETMGHGRVVNGCFKAPTLDAATNFTNTRLNQKHHQPAARALRISPAPMFNADHMARYPTTNESRGFQLMSFPGDAKPGLRSRPRPTGKTTARTTDCKDGFQSKRTAGFSWTAGKSTSMPVHATGFRESGAEISEIQTSP